MISGCKVTTHDLRPPVRGGDPIWDGTLPFDLPKVEVDVSDAACAAGWNACREAHTALRIGGLWPNGWPSRLWCVELPDDAIERGDKLRGRTLQIVTEVTDVREAVARLSEPFGGFADKMIDEQMAWRLALSRPAASNDQIEDGLRVALRSRSLDWTLRRFPSAWDAWDTWDTWDARDARAAWAVWDARDARAAWAVRAVWDARDARAARAARAAWAVWDARDARAAWDARAALTWHYAARKGWIGGSADKYTVGIRDAYAHGLAIALPTGPNELGWAPVDNAGWR